MGRFRVEFQRLVQDRQDINIGDDQMVSTAYFDLFVDGERHAGLAADLKQSVAAGYASDPIEVSWPSGYTGDFNYEGFRDCVEAYYRRCVSVELGFAGQVRMRNTTFAGKESCEF